MSLVGTRPILQDELRQYELHHRARIAIKPGITGMWQVSGRSDITDFEEVVRLDTEYISKRKALRMSSIGVLGAGTWGMALARMLSNSGQDVTVWSAIKKEIDDLSSTRCHPNLPDMIIPDTIVFTKSIEEVCVQKDIILFAVPSVFVRSTAEKARQYIPDGQIVVDVAKGIEADTLYTMSEVIRDEIQKDGLHPNAKIVALSGPTHAEEVACDMPTTIVSACTDLDVAEKVQDVFMNTCMRVYTNVDVHGVELCGALKNIIALAAGISKGLGYGDNAKAALITRGMAEISRLGVAMGCMEQTFNGLAGIGDLIVTATSEHSRNNRAGQLIGNGCSPSDAIKRVGMVVEGVNALPAVMQLMQRYDIDMPIVTAVNAVVNEGADPKEIVTRLMSRDKKSELPKSILDINFESTILKNRRSSTGMRSRKNVISHMKREKHCWSLFVMSILLFLKKIGNRREQMCMNIM